MDGAEPSSSTSMLLDFAFLSMTELRNTPGEILDRVAEGEAFIIERSGHRKACLVPLSVFFPDISPSRIAAEFDELRERGEKARPTITEKLELAIHFNANPAGGSVDLTIVLPHGYPNSCPRVYADLGDGNIPHRWHDGALCLYGVMAAWNPGKHTVFTTLGLARRWVQRYNAWRDSGHWPTQEEPSHE